MKYKNANTVLPKALVQELQNYVQAGYLYVPARAKQHKAWGSLSGYRAELAQRNAAIGAQYRAGVSVDALATQYHLSAATGKKKITSTP